MGTLLTFLAEPGCRKFRWKEDYHMHPCAALAAFPCCPLLTALAAADNSAPAQPPQHPQEFNMCSSVLHTLTHMDGMLPHGLPHL
jgi:hypothetical protein